MLRDYLRKLINRNKKKVVYTAISGDYDELLKPAFINDDWDYICFTDNENMKSDFWHIHEMDNLKLDPVRKNRVYKILPHKYLSEYDYSLYIDGNFRIRGDIEEYILRFSKGNPMICIVHPERDCIYEEAKVCVAQKKDSEDVIRNQIRKYNSENYPTNFGLIAGGILFRKHNNPNVIKVMNSWWREVKSQSRRDQLSFNYACWKNNFNYDVCDLCYWGNEFFEYFQHKGLLH